MFGFFFRTALLSFILSVAFLIATIIYLQQTTLDTGLNFGKQTEDIKATKQDMVLHFINLQVGKAILIQQGQNGVLVDVGDKEDSDTLLQNIKEDGIKEINSIFLTNWTKDNIGGIIPILKQFPHANLYIPSVTSSNYPILEQPYKKINAGEKIILSKEPAISMDILSPIGPLFHDPFNDSMVAILQYQKINVLLTSDIHEEAENRLLTEYPSLKAEIMTVPDRPTGLLHSQNFLKAVDPQTAVMIKMPCSRCDQIVRDASNRYSQQWSDFFFIPIGKNLKIFFNQNGYITPKNQIK